MIPVLYEEVIRRDGEHQARQGDPDDGHQQPGCPGSTEADHASQFEDADPRKGKVDADQLAELLFRNPARYRFGL